MTADEAIAEARDMVAKNFTCEPCVVETLLAALDLERKKARGLRKLIAECYERLQYREHCGGLPYGVESKVIREIAVMREDAT